MMKFFRKYNKQLLAFFMVGLMIVFVGGSALQGLLTSTPNPVLAGSAYGQVTLMDQKVAGDQTKLLEYLGFDWTRPVGGGHKPLETTDWILLRREADKLGAVVDPAAIRTALNDPEMDERVNDVSRRARVKPEAIHAALADLRTIQQAAGAVAGATTPSEAEVMTAARDALETVSIRAVVLPAQAFVDPNLNFSEDEIKTQFAAHREKERGEGLNFGYYRQPSVSVQYIEIDRKVVAENIGVANLERKAKTYFEEQRTKDPVFRRPGGAPADAAAAGLIEGPPAPPMDAFLTWDEAKEKAVLALRTQYAEQAATRLADWMIQYSAESLVEVQRGEDGYKPAPLEVAKLEYYDEMVRRIPESMKFPKAVAIGETDFFTAEEAADMPDLGDTEFKPEKGSSQPFGALAFRSQPVVPKIPIDDGANPVDYLATFQTCAFPLTDRDTGNLYVFRVVGGQGGRAAESVDEVRDLVVEDLRLLRGYEVAKTRAASLRQCLASQSLKEAYEGDADLTEFKESAEGAASGYFEPAPITRVVKNQAARGRSKSGVFAGIGIGFVPNDVIDGLFALEHADEKAKTFELRDRAAIVLAEWIETKPAAEDEFNILRKQLVQQLADARWRSAVADWLDPKHIRARTGFALAGK